jgi:hypothetical protein
MLLRGNVPRDVHVLLQPILDYDLQHLREGAKEDGQFSLKSLNVNIRKTRNPESKSHGENVDGALIGSWRRRRTLVLLQSLINRTKLQSYVSSIT